MKGKLEPSERQKLIEEGLHHILSWNLSAGNTMIQSALKFFYRKELKGRACYFGRRFVKAY